MGSVAQAPGAKVQKGPDLEDIQTEVRDEQYPQRCAADLP